MPHLVSIEDFGQHFNEDIDEDVKPTVSRALDLASYFIQEQIECEFDQHSRTDKFAVNDRMPRVGNTRILLRLSSGLVSPDQPVSVSMKGAGYEEFAEPDTFDVDYRRGYLTIDEVGMAKVQSVTIPANWDFLVTFQAGFEVEEDDVGQLYKAVPKDLKDMCLLQAVEVYEKIVEEKEPVFTVLKESQALKRYTRFHSARVLPYHSELA